MGRVKPWCKHHNTKFESWNEYWNHIQNHHDDTMVAHDGGELIIKYEGPDLPTPYKHKEKV